MMPIQRACLLVVYWRRNLSGCDDEFVARRFTLKFPVTVVEVGALVLSHRREDEVHRSSWYYLNI